ncbi:hypothetical protein [Pontibacter pudoricolor]|uniref:hypothetical protein n=1 Tax=Pontibacter pudoricolor TaxID=2694930 RepID=UPI0013909426|nr:hypothetical protein [Pontibacter pudoricolor]
MEIYRYSFEDWLKGEIHNEDLEGLVENKQLDKEDLKKIRSDQEIAYSIYIAMHLQMMKVAFYQRYEYSFAKEDLLNQQLKNAEEDLQNFKVNNPVLYWEAINGIDNRYKLTPPFIPFYLMCSPFIDELEEIVPTHITYYTKSNFYRWLNWLKEDGKSDTEPSFEVSNEDFKKQVERSQKRLDRLLELDSKSAKEYAQEFFQLSFIKERVVKLMTEQATDTLDKSAFKQQGSNTPKEKLSYTWLSKSDTDLIELHQHLINAKLIDPATTLEQFKAVFRAQPLHIVKDNPIKWHEDNASELLYFILQLEGTDDEMYPDGWLIKKGNRANYKRLTACFVKPDGEQFTENFKQAKQNLKDPVLAPAKQAVIDSIVNQFY